MALTERTRDYETLIRYNDDGSIGASHATIYEVVDDSGSIITARVNAPAQLAVAAAGDSALTTILGPALIASETEKASLNDQVSALKQKVVELQAQVVASQPPPAAETALDSSAGAGD